MSGIAIEARITGRVQGVGFRAWTKDQAGGLGLAGWVRNEADGAVRALIAGPEESVAQMVARLRQGPRAARVDRVETQPAAMPDAAGFRIIR